MRFVSGFLLAFMVSGAAGCGDAHMGEGYGRRTRSALDAQAARGGEGGLPLDGDDARMVMQQHRLGGGAAAATGGFGGGSMGSTSSYGGYSPSSTGSTVGGVVATPIAPIRLDAR